jgi:hypothetical protein
LLPNVWPECHADRLIVLAQLRSDCRPAERRR